MTNENKNPNQTVEIPSDEALDLLYSLLKKYDVDRVQKVLDKLSDRYCQDNYTFLKEANRCPNYQDEYDFMSNLPNLCVIALNCVLAMAQSAANRPINCN